MKSAVVFQRIVKFWMLHEKKESWYSLLEASIFLLYYVQMPFPRASLKLSSNCSGMRPKVRQKELNHDLISRQIELAMFDRPGHQLTASSRSHV